MSFGGGGGSEIPEEYGQQQQLLAQELAGVGDQLLDEYSWATMPYQEASTLAAYSLLGPTLGLNQQQLAQTARNMGWASALTDAQALSDLSGVNFYNTQVQPYQERLLDDSTYISDVMRPVWGKQAEAAYTGLSGMLSEAGKIDPEADAAKALADVSTQYDTSAATQARRMSSYGLNPADSRWQYMQNENALQKASDSVAAANKGRWDAKDKLWSRFTALANVNTPSQTVGSSIFGLNPTVRVPSVSVPGLSAQGLSPSAGLDAYKAAYSSLDSAGKLSKTSEDTSASDAAGVMGGLAQMGMAVAAFL